MERADDLIAEQLLYYRARAAEYDATGYGAVPAEMSSVLVIIDRLGIFGGVRRCGHT